MRHLRYFVRSLFPTVRPSIASSILFGVGSAVATSSRYLILAVTLPVMGISQVLREEFVEARNSAPAMSLALSGRPVMPQDLTYTLSFFRAVGKSFF